MTSAMVSKTKIKRARILGYDLEGAMNRAAEVGRRFSADSDPSHYALNAALKEIPLPAKGHGLGDLYAAFLDAALVACRFDECGNFTAFGKAEHAYREHIADLRTKKDREREEWVLHGQDQQRATIRAVLESAGFAEEFVSDSGSQYFARYERGRRVRVRVSDHALPDTDERRYNHERGWRCAEYEIVLAPELDAIVSAEEIIVAMADDGEVVG
jgi:hypothetical protein